MGRAPRADDSDEPLTAALRSLPSGDAPSESEELGIEAAAFNAVVKPLALSTRAGIAETTFPCADCNADASDEIPPLPLPPRDVALTVSGVVCAESDDAMTAKQILQVTQMRTVPQSGYG